MDTLPNVTIENAKILFRNFEGRKEPFNSLGDRNFCVLLDPESAHLMRQDGWNVKLLKVREEGDEPEAYLPVSVNYDKGRPPRCVMITSKGRVDLGAGEVNVFDWADVRTVDMILNPYPWTVDGKSGIKAYLKSIFVTLNEDELELKYADVQSASPNASVHNDDD